MASVRSVVGIAVLFVAAMHLSTNAREIGDRFESGGQECIITDRWTDSATNSEVTTEFCCNEGETLQGEGACLANPVNDFLVSAYQYAVGLGLPAFANAGGGGGRGPRPSGTPDKPTEALCEWTHKGCMDNASNYAKSCESAMYAAALDLVMVDRYRENGKLDTPGTCFGEVQAIIKGIPPIKGYRCHETCVNHDCNPKLLNECRDRFKWRALYNCSEGFPESTVTSQKSETFKPNYGGAEIFGKTDTQITTMTTAAGEGNRTYCAGKAREQTKQCTAFNIECRRRAGLSSPVQATMDLDSEVEALISRINQGRLGLPPPQMTAPPNGSFRPIERNTATENTVFYASRLRFLAGWSDFITQHGVTKQQQQKVQLALSDAQVTFQSAETRLAVLVVNVLVPIPSQGPDAPRLHNNELIMYLDPYTRYRYYERRMEGAEKALQTKLLEALGKRRADLFTEQVWTNIHDFGFAAPMTKRQVSQTPK